MEELALGREQAARLRAALDAGRLWIRQGPSDPYPVQEHELIVPALLPDYVFTIQQFRGRQCVVVEFGLDGGPPGLAGCTGSSPRPRHTQSRTRR